MGSAQEKTRFSVQEYLAWEESQVEKHEYLAGEVFGMVGARQDHVIVTGNVFAQLREHLRGAPCRALVADMKLSVPAMEAFFYPDVMVTCDDNDKRADLCIEHPRLIIEILSDSAAAYDRGAKFAAYRKIDSLEEFALVDIDRRGVESYQRQPDGLWLLHDFTGAESCQFGSVDLTMSMARVFEDV